MLKAQNMDGIGNSEWPKLQMLVDLLKRFAEHTDRLQSDNTFSSIIPAALDILCFLDHVLPVTCITIARQMKASLTRRTLRFFDVDETNFEPLPGAASYLDSTIFNNFS